VFSFAPLRRVSSGPRAHVDGGPVSVLIDPRGLGPWRAACSGFVHSGVADATRDDKRRAVAQTEWEKEWGSVTAKLFGQVFGVVILLLGVVGLVAGNQLLGFVNTELLEDIIHLVTGAILAYVGFMLADEATGRTIVGVLGVVYLLVGVAGFLSPTLFGLLPAVGYTVADNLVHLVIGALGTYVGFFGPRMATTPAART
jgi:hypothetical protein